MTTLIFVMPPVDLFLAVTNHAIHSLPGGNFILRVLPPQLIAEGFLVASTL